MFFEYFCNRAVRSFGECLKALEKFDMSKYDSIMVYSYWFFVTALVGVMLKEHFSEFCSDVKLYSRAHRYDVYEDMNVLNYLPLRRYLLENCDGVFPCSNSGTEHIARRYPEYADKIKTSYLGTMDGANVEIVEEVGKERIRRVQNKLDPHRRRKQKE